MNKYLRLAFSTYIFWGLFRCFGNSLHHFSALEILSHRIIWSFFAFYSIIYFVIQNSLSSPFWSIDRKSFLIDCCCLGFNYSKLVNLYLGSQCGSYHQKEVLLTLSSTFEYDDGCLLFSRSVDTIFIKWQACVPCWSLMKGFYHRNFRGSLFP